MWINELELEPLKTLWPYRDDQVGYQTDWHHLWQSLNILASEPMSLKARERCVEPECAVYLQALLGRQWNWPCQLVKVSPTFNKCICALRDFAHGNFIFETCVLQGFCSDVVPYIVCFSSYEILWNKVLVAFLYIPGRKLLWLRLINW